MKRAGRKYSLLSLGFILTPPFGIGLIGLLAYSQSVDVRAAIISDTLMLTVGASFLAALIGWAIFLRPPKQISDGKKAGRLTVFLCYLFCIGPIAVAAGSWDGLLGVGTYYFSLFVFGQIATFWITYPIGAWFGRWVAKRML